MGGRFQLRTATRAMVVRMVEQSSDAAQETMVKPLKSAASATGRQKVNKAGVEVAEEQRYYESNSRTILPRCALMETSFRSTPTSRMATIRHQRTCKSPQQQQRQSSAHLLAGHSRQ